MQRRPPAYEYKPVPTIQDDAANVDLERVRRRPNRIGRNIIVMIALSIFVLAVLGFSLKVSTAPLDGKACDSISKGYQCSPRISHFWGQYSPYYAVPSDISPGIPKTCRVTFAQVLSRHGARDPTASKTATYGTFIAKLHANVQSYPGKYAFLKDYQYTLGADQLTTFGQQEMVNSGIEFYQRYRSLARILPTFFRAADQERVVQSAENFTQGYHETRQKDKLALGKDNYPYPIVEISEAAGQNNTLNHDLCTAFEDGYASTYGDDAQKKWRSAFAPKIQARLNADLPGAGITEGEVIYFMDMCPFNTIAAPGGTISPFCDLFTEDEWHQYDYLQSLGKYYGYGNGNPLGPTQGVGFTNELIARMTGKPVKDETSVNHTLDDSPKTFPVGIGHQLFADFSHDNDMTTIYSVIGLYNDTAPLSNTTIQTTKETSGYAASWTAPFAGRAYFEKLVCAGYPEELVRVLVNDRVIPLKTCGGDALGRCRLSKFIDSLSFARGGGKWNQCFV